MNKEKKTFGIKDIISEANIYQCATVYANHAQFMLVNNEAYLDFYLIEPAKPKLQDKPTSTLVARIAVPISMAKGIATGLANAVDQHEKALKLKLPNQRGKHPSDGIVIWEEK